MNKYPLGLKTNRFIDCLVLLGILRQYPALQAQIINGIVYVNQPVDDIVDYIVTYFEPESIFTPHNKSGGFKKGNKNSKGASNVKHIENIRNSTADRFQLMQRSIQCIDDAFNATGYDPTNDKKSEDAKQAFVDALFAYGDYRLKTWLDVVYATTESGLKALPMAGKAGSEGSGEYSKSYADAIFAEYDIDGQPSKSALRDLQALLLGRNSPTRQKISPGRYVVSGGIGSQFGGSTPVPSINPWELLLGMSGLMFFASTTSRHIDGRDQGSAVIPFTVSASQLGYASATQGERGACEVFFPHWDAMVNGKQLQFLFRVGRGRIDDKPASNGMKFLVSISRWAASASIPRFSRFIALERASDRGNAWFCCQGIYEPIPEQDASLLSQAEYWVFSYCRDTKSQYLGDQYYGVFAGERRLTDLALALGKSFIHAQSSSKLTKNQLPHLTTDWIIRLLEENPDCIELRLALALCRFPITFWKSNNIVPTLIKANQYWAKAWSQCASNSSNQDPILGRHAKFARLDDISAFINETTNDTLIIDFVRFLSVIRPELTKIDVGLSHHSWFLPEGFKVIAGVWHWCKLWHPNNSISFPFEGQLLTGLASGQSKPAIETALRRLRQNDAIVNRNSLQCGFDLPINQSQRWAASLAFCLSDKSVERLLHITN